MKKEQIQKLNFTRLSLKKTNFQSMSEHFLLYSKPKILFKINGHFILLLTVCEVCHPVHLPRRPSFRNRSRRAYPCPRGRVVGSPRPDNGVGARNKKDRRGRPTFLSASLAASSVASYSRPVEEISGLRLNRGPCETSDLKDL